MQDTCGFPSIFHLELCHRQLPQGKGSSICAMIKAEGIPAAEPYVVQQADIGEFWTLIISNMLSGEQHNIIGPVLCSFSTNPQFNHFLDDTWIQSAA